jgi:uncharacterized protein (DUF488 family)
MSGATPRQETHWPQDAVFTVGHSTLPIGDFIALLQHYGIETLADIRTIPRSRRNPQFESTALAGSLRAAGISYVHMKALGGLRHPRADSPNKGWRNDSFRGYADYMQTPEFARALEELVALSSEKRTAIMCAEAVPWRCHRSLVSDALLVRGIPVIEILSPASSRPHKLTAFAQVDEDMRLTYPPEQAELL